MIAALFLIVYMCACVMSVKEFWIMMMLVVGNYIFDKYNKKKMVKHVSKGTSIL